MNSTSMIGENPAAASMPGAAAPRRRDWRIPASLMVIAWIAFLAHRAWTSANIDIVSRPQLLSAPIVVDGKLLIDPPRIEVRRVWFVDERWKKENPDQAARIAPGSVLDFYFRVDPALDRGGLFLFPLYAATKTGFEVWGAPRGIGEPGPVGEPRIYPLTDTTLHQVETLIRFRGTK